VIKDFWGTFQGLKVFLNEPTAFFVPQRLPIVLKGIKKSSIKAGAIVNYPQYRSVINFDI
jgi:hypothetical protein